MTQVCPFQTNLNTNRCHLETVSPAPIRHQSDRIWPKQIIAGGHTSVRRSGHVSHLARFDQKYTHVLKKKCNQVAPTT